MNQRPELTNEAGIGAGVVLTLIGVFALGLLVGWFAHGFTMHRMMGGSMMDMMGGDGMHERMHGEREPGMMGRMMDNGMDREQMQGMMGGMMDMMMGGEGCERMMGMMEDHHRSMRHHQNGDQTGPMGRMMDRMDDEQMRQHCRSMHASMMAMMEDRLKPESDESSREREQAERPEGFNQLDEQYQDWMDSIRGNAEPHDARGIETVTVEVGAGQRGLQFSPAVLRIDPGTTVEFVWTGEGGSHDVMVLETEEQSPLMYGEGDRYALQFDDPGVYRYVCTPHEFIGMKGLILVEEA